MLIKEPKFEISAVKEEQYPKALYPIYSHKGNEIFDNDVQL